MSQISFETVSDESLYLFIDLANTRMMRPYIEAELLSTLFFDINKSTDLPAPTNSTTLVPQALHLFPCLSVKPEISPPTDWISSLIKVAKSLFLSS